MRAELRVAKHLFSAQRIWLGVCVVLSGFTLLTHVLRAPATLSEIVTPVERSVEATSAVQVNTVIVRPEQLKLERRPIITSLPDPFWGADSTTSASSTQTSAIGIGPPAVATLYAEPVAQTAPYRFFGQVQDASSATQIFLARENQLIPIKVGEVLDGQYRVAAITDSTVDLVYLPLNQMQQIGR
jgi:hypothetical protein